MSEDIIPAVEDAVTTSLRYGAIANGTAAAACLGAISQVWPASSHISLTLCIGLILFCFGLGFAILGTLSSFIVHMNYGPIFFNAFHGHARNVFAAISNGIMLLTMLIGSTMLLTAAVDRRLSEMNSRPERIARAIEQAEIDWLQSHGSEDGVYEAMAKAAISGMK